MLYWEKGSTILTFYARVGQPATLHAGLLHTTTVVCKQTQMCMANLMKDNGDTHHLGVKMPQPKHSAGHLSDQSKSLY